MLADYFFKSISCLGSQKKLFFRNSDNNEIQLASKLNTRCNSCEALDTCQKEIELIMMDLNVTGST
jgi:hypothetical protein